MNDFIGAFDSFESDVVAQVQGEDGVIQQEDASLSKLLLKRFTSRENSGSFLAFDKIDEDRPALRQRRRRRGHGKMDSGNGHGFAEDAVKVSTVIQEGKWFRPARLGSSTRRQISAVIHKFRRQGLPSSSNIPRAPVVDRSGC